MGAISDHETMLARLGEVDAGRVDRDATIPAIESAGTARELPRISIDLQSTLPGKRGAGRADPPAVERDLEVVGTLGEGGMGRVLLARQHSLDREVAIK